jgi:hypothetical protein
MEEVDCKKPGEKISYLKVFTINRDHYGEKLSGLRCYTKSDKILLSVGWFQDCDCKLVELKANELVTGIRARFHPAQPATLYDCQFCIKKI